METEKTTKLGQCGDCAQGIIGKVHEGFAKGGTKPDRRSQSGLYKLDKIRRPDNGA